MKYNTQVKICGITNVENALDIVELENVKYIGCINYEGSKRHISLDQITEIFQKSKSNRKDIKCVLLLVNPTEEYIVHAMKKTGADILQLSGNESGSMVNDLDLYTVWKTIHIKDIDDLKKMNEYFHVDRFILDTKVEDKFGGTGQQFDLNIFNEAKKLTKNLVLAGGINSESITNAILSAHPEIIDISSGVEIAPGIKDIEKISRIIKLIDESASYN